MILFETFEDIFSWHDMMTLMWNDIFLRDVLWRYSYEENSMKSWIQFHWKLKFENIFRWNYVTSTIFRAHELILFETFEDIFVAWCDDIDMT